MIYIGGIFRVSWPTLRCSPRCTIMRWEYTIGTIRRLTRITRLSWRQSNWKRPDSRRPQRSALENSPTWLSYIFRSTLSAPCWAWTYRSSDKGKSHCGYFSSWWWFLVSWHTSLSPCMWTNKELSFGGWRSTWHGALFLRDSGFLRFPWPTTIARISRLWTPVLLKYSWDIAVAGPKAGWMEGMIGSSRRPPGAARHFGGRRWKRFFLLWKS